MTVRVEPETKEPAIVSKQEFERDWQRGYAVTIFAPETVEIIRDARSGHEIRRPIKAVLNYCCMHCLFSTIVEDTIKKHMTEQAAQPVPHPWYFDPFTNPYGHFMDVQIEGIDKHNYHSIVKERS